MKLFITITTVLIAISIRSCDCRASKYDSKLDPDRIIFPEDNAGTFRVLDKLYPIPNIPPVILKPNVSSSKYDTTDRYTEIPLEFAQKLNEVKNVSDLLLHYVDSDDIFEEVVLANRFGDNFERKAAIEPKFATCQPALQVVDLKNSTNPSLFYVPPCTRVERCGGCCSHSLLSCQPTETELVPFQVLVTEFTGNERLKIREKEVILVEKHIKCKCDCKVKESDCNASQIYRKSDCRCLCGNLDERRKCDKSNNTKLWDPSTCKCLCRETKDCSTGYYFDQNKCKCSPVPLRRRFAEFGSEKERTFQDKEIYDVSPLDVEPIQKT